MCRINHGPVTADEKTDELLKTSINFKEPLYSFVHVTGSFLYS